MPTSVEPLEVSLDELRKLVDDLLQRHGISNAEFDELGRSEELLDIDPLLDFVYKSVWPLLKSNDRPAA